MMMDIDENTTKPQGAKKGGAKKKAVGGGGTDALKTTSTQRLNAGNEDDRTIEQIYQKKTQLEHILLRPDTYIGSTESSTQPMWVLDSETKQIVQRPITYTPGLYKIFDEIIVNASDNKQRDPSMDTIRVDIDQDAGTISVWNNGKGIPVVIHKEHQIYVPELIFGNLLTGSNFDDGMKKTTGGRNGYGAKLANIFSTRFTIETADSKTGKKYKQTFRDNMGIREEPQVTPMSSKETEYTCVTFEPDFARFKMDSLDDNTVALLSKRAYDVAGCASSFKGKSLKVFLNGQRVAVNSFTDYLKLYRGLDAPVACDRVNERWEVAVGVSDGQFQQVSFVNGICTTKGGQHVNHVADQVIQKLMASVKKKNKGQEVKGHQIKNHLAVYVNALIENPAFDSQTKETLTTRPSAFASDCSLSDKFLKQVEKSGVVDNIVNWAKFKQDEQLKRKGGSKRSKVIGITKLDDANFAGSTKSKDCTLILTEGDSAKALAVSGLSVVGRDYYGVFPLKGKPLNVREASHQQIMKNEEIQNIVKILGLRFGTEYTDTNSLRYGHLLIMADQDHDGSHIKGLLINFIHHFWPSLLKIDGFLQEFITPIVKVSKGNKYQTFYTIPEYEAWKEEHNEGRGWNIKYYKGLGTSTAAEGKEYFSDLKTHRLDFDWQGDGDGDLIDMAFAKKRVEERKEWLRHFEKGTHVNYKVESMTYNNFINRELILFSIADCQRSIPALMDGLKPAQRKVLFACFKRNLKKEIKVAQLAGFVSEHAAYHHGEASLTSTIVGMAQNFVGANNVNLLFPSGQFGTRLMGGKDAASARYVFTRLEDITRYLFHPDDDPLLSYLEEDGQSIEPETYMPIIPTVLVNGSEGIGTGWSSSVPNYNPLDIIENIRRKIRGEDMEEMHPWYRGFIGTITPKPGKERGSYVVTGTFQRLDETTIEVTELPVKKWTQDYKQFLESMMVGLSEDKTAFVKDFKERHTDTSVYFVVTLAADAAPELLHDDAALAKRLKLETSMSTTNMHLYDLQGEIRKYDSALTVVEDFFDVRLDLYTKRRTHLLQKLEREWRKLDNKVRFILAVVEGRLVVSNRKKAELLEELVAEGYETFSPNRKDEEEGEESGEMDAGELAQGYDYLLSMKLWSLTLERVEELRSDLDQKADELAALRATTPSDMWIKDLDELEQAFLAYQESLEFEPAIVVSKNGASKRGGGGKKGGAKSKARPKKVINLDSDEDEESDFDFDDDSDSDFEPAAKAKKQPAKKAPPAPKPQPAAAKPAPAKKAAPPKPAPALTTSKATKKVVEEEEDNDDDDDVEVLSLAERMKMRMQVTPSKPNKAQSDDDDEEEEDEIARMITSPSPPPKPIAKAKAAPAAKKPPTVPKAAGAGKGGGAAGGGVKRGIKKGGAGSASTSQANKEDVFFFSPEKGMSPAVVKKARTTKPATKKPVPAPAPAEPSVPINKPRRAAATKVVYTFSDDDDDSEEEVEQASSGSDFDGGDSDSDSDF